MAALLPQLAANAVELDASATFPLADMVRLREAGVLAAPLPVRLGGLGAGKDPASAELLCTLLRTLGRGSLPVARLFEAHVNALRLIERFGTTEQRAQAASDVFAGHLFGLWVTDPSQGPALQHRGANLHGSKGPCSGAGHCTRALITAETSDGTRMAVIALSGQEQVQPIAGLQGMRAAANGTIVLDGVSVLFWLGLPDDYLREPEFSCGAWRSSAAASGGLDALVEIVRATLVRRGQSDAPMQLARFSELLIAQRTARFWAEHAAQIAEALHEDPAEQVATINLARIAIETACLDGMRLAQRSLGLAAFIAPNPADRIARDLATYLRQPAPDSVLLEAAAWHLARG